MNSATEGAVGELEDHTKRERRPASSPPASYGVFNLVDGVDVADHVSSMRITLVERLAIVTIRVAAAESAGQLPHCNELTCSIHLYPQPMHTVTGASTRT